MASGTLTLPDVLEFEEANMNPTSHTDRLREMLGNDSRLVASKSPLGFYGFQSDTCRASYRNMTMANLSR